MSTRRAPVGIHPHRDPTQRYGWLSRRARPALDEKAYRLSFSSTVAKKFAKAGMTGYGKGLEVPEEPEETVGSQQLQPDHPPLLRCSQPLEQLS